MNSSKFDEMFKFISQYKYEISGNVPDNLKCGKCKNVLINAYYVPCGCSYCCDCVNEMLDNGVENCPGKTEYCKDELISNNQVDHRRNREISNFVWKCPEEMCLYECAIINMEEHVRVCEKKSVKCPFANVGCDGKKIAREMLNDHCQSANFNHCKILIELIDNMRNEIDILKANDLKNQLKIENLEKNLKSKDEIIDKINKEIEWIKVEKENVKQEFDWLKENIKQEFDWLKENLERKIEEMIDDKMKRENEDEDKRECDKINLVKKTKEIFAEMQKEKQERIESINAIKMETNKKSEMMETRINELNKIIDYFDYARIEWIIDKLDEKRKKGGWIESEYFTGMIKKYKFQLSFNPDWGTGIIKGKGCSMFLRIYPDVNNELLSWPFTADVTIKMTSKINPNINKSITKYCKIDKPTNESYELSERFNFFYSDLTKNGEMLDNCFIVECFINFKYSYRPIKLN